MSAQEREFPGTADMVEAARGFVGEGLAAADDLPREVIGDALLCVSELAGNAVTHSHSGKPGGKFTALYEVTSGYVRVEVRDAGGPWTQPLGLGAGDDDEHGRGLLIVRQLGSLYVQNVPGRPGRVGVLIPYTAAAVLAAPADTFEVTQ